MGARTMVLGWICKFCMGRTLRRWTKIIFLRVEIVKPSSIREGIESSGLSPGKAFINFLAQSRPISLGQTGTIVRSSFRLNDIILDNL